MARLVIVAIAGSVFIPAVAQANDSPNTCTASVDGARQGVHTFDLDYASSVLWPPNHKTRTEKISATNANNKPCNVDITDARSDEAVDSEGSGKTTTDDAINCKNAGNASYVDLRGERDGGGDGRFYHLPITMDDPDSDQPKVDDIKVLVPHDQGVKKTFTDEGATFAAYHSATLACSS